MKCNGRCKYIRTEFDLDNMPVHRCTAQKNMPYIDVGFSICPYSEHHGGYALKNSYPSFYEEVKRQLEINELIEDVKKLVETACNNCEHKNTNCSDCFVDQFVNKYMR